MFVLPLEDDSVEMKVPEVYGVYVRIGVANGRAAVIERETGEPVQNLTRDSDPKALVARWDETFAALAKRAGRTA